MFLVVLFIIGLTLWFLEITLICGKCNKEKHFIYVCVYIWLYIYIICVYIIYIKRSCFALALSLADGKCLLELLLKGC